MLARAARPERPERLSALRPAAAGRRALRAPARLTGLLLVAALAGCGGDDEPQADPTPTLPDLAVPETDTGTAPTPTVVEPPPPPSTTVDPGTEPLAPEGTGEPGSAPPQDTPENDAPPPEDSPAERFEEYCNENPGACG